MLCQFKKYQQILVKLHKQVLSVHWVRAISSSALLFKDIAKSYLFITHILYQSISHHTIHCTYGLSEQCLFLVTGSLQVGCVIICPFPSQLYLSAWLSQCSKTSQRLVPGWKVCCNRSPFSNCNAISTSVSARDFSAFTSSSLALFGRLAYRTDKVKSSVVLLCLKIHVTIKSGWQLDNQT